MSLKNALSPMLLKPITVAIWTIRFFWREELIQIGMLLANYNLMSQKKVLSPMLCKPITVAIQINNYDWIVEFHVKMLCDMLFLWLWILML